MSDSIAAQELPPSLAARLRERFGRRAIGLALAIAVEVLLVLILVLMGPAEPVRRREVPMSTFAMDADMSEPAEEVAAPEPADEPPTSAPETPSAPAETPLRPSPAPVAVVTPPPPIVPPPPAAVRVAAPPPAAAPAPPARPRRVYGPPGSAAPAGARDSEVVGRAPNGQPLYAAAWYREPYPEELRGYLSTATGPGYGLIACRIVPGFRVEDCVGLDEWPNGSNITRSVLAAAWQFRVRPPRVGGELKFGEWVRIRIDYEQRRQ